MRHNIRFQMAQLLLMTRPGNQQALSEAERALRPGTTERRLNMVDELQQNGPQSGSSCEEDCYFRQKTLFFAGRGSA